MLENPALEVKKLTVPVFIRKQNHVSALEVEQNHIANQVGEAWLKLR
jgi:hypothetical protein